MNPSIGRVVHYVSYGTPGGEYTKQCRAAVVTEVAEAIESDRRSQVVSLAVLNPTGMFFNEGCRYSESAQVGGTWHWPERVEG